MTYIPGQPLVNYDASPATAIGNSTQEIIIFSRSIEANTLGGKGEILLDIDGFGQTGLLVPLPSLSVYLRFGTAMVEAKSGINPLTVNVSSDFHLSARLMQSTTPGMIFMRLEVFSQFYPSGSVWLKSDTIAQDATVPQTLSVGIKFASLLSLAQASITPKQFRMKIPG